MQPSGRRAGVRPARHLPAAVLAAAARLLERGCVRIGGDEYARGVTASFGPCTPLREHVSVRRDRTEFRFPAKGGADRAIRLTDPATGRRSGRSPAAVPPVRRMPRGGWQPNAGGFRVRVARRNMSA